MARVEGDQPTQELLRLEHVLSRAIAAAALETGEKPSIPAVQAIVHKRRPRDIVLAHVGRTLGRGWRKSRVANSVSNMSPCAGKTGEVQRMEESYGEGPATHTGPESCAVDREVGGEALTGGGAGRVSSREIVDNSGVPTSWRQAEGHTNRVATARRERTPRDLRPRARTDTPRTGTGRSHDRRRQREGPQAAPGSPRT
ncbi:MAG: hypothetical protein ACRD1X_04700, partial [Vicinamibacteria bacterium]